MKIEHQPTVKPVNSLTPLQKFSLITATVFAFAGIYYWFFKILFF